MEDQILIKYILDHWGILGILAATPAVLAVLYHRQRITELKTWGQEQKDEKADYKNVLTGNTEAITKMAGALESNTQAMRDLRNYIERGK